MKTLLTILSVLTTASATTPLIIHNYDNFSENQTKVSDIQDFRDSYDTTAMQLPANEGEQTTTDFTATLADFIKNEFLPFIKENNVSKFEVTEATSQFQGTALAGTLALLAQNYNKILHAAVDYSDFSVVAVNGIVTNVGYGNYSWSLIASVYFNGASQEFSLNGYQPNQEYANFQITSPFSNNLTIDYTKSESIDHQDTTPQSAIALPNHGFYYYAWQLKDMFNLDSTYKTAAIDYINKTLSMSISEISIDQLEIATPGSEGTYVPGDKYSDDTIVQDKLFYLAITSTEATGTFHLLLENLTLN
ncbi:hypothetical protein [Spiroplasma eriocheiris]|uniref:Uncharacterized protein n=1 Tax=Spiroplasma eriocheiris TaxID=315358 RepID=A0A0H3XLF4_9MOLU|nr:hypothetical protein [Spiroplasma eriocheiris]AHF57891.1 hypothetical protein SPE_0769 [Spiroplasma eriocheiris CCTCC M 207170]AKM54334.1 hypothetical protein SERIO_v1c07720 [Spiroplasma eriocheiris]